MFIILSIALAKLNIIIMSFRHKGNFLFKISIKVFIKFISWRANILLVFIIDSIWFLDMKRSVKYLVISFYLIWTSIVVLVTERCFCKLRSLLLKDIIFSFLTKDGSLLRHTSAGLFSAKIQPVFSEQFHTDRTLVINISLNHYFSLESLLVPHNSW